jgi:hypothetical protein
LSEHSASRIALVAGIHGCVRNRIERAGRRREIGTSRTQPGSVSALVVIALPNGRAWHHQRKSRTAGSWSARGEHGHKPVALLQRENVRTILARKAATPHAANNLHKLIRLLMRFAIEEDWRRDDPTIEVRAVKVRSDGFYTWTEDDIAAFKRRWAIGTKQRLAMELALNTRQRRSDLVRMGKQHIRNGRIEVTQQKTNTKLAIPIHGDLQAVLDSTPSGHLTFLTTAYGQPFMPAGFGGWFRAACDSAGLPKRCSGAWASQGRMPAPCRSRMLRKCDCGDQRPSHAGGSCPIARSNKPTSSAGMHSRSTCRNGTADCGAVARSCLVPLEPLRKFKRTALSPEHLRQQK